MNMDYRLFVSGAFVCALTLVGYAGQADATTRLMLSAPSLTILAQDEENAEVQNLLEPESDGGTPMGDAAKPEGAPKAGEEMKAMPEGGNAEMKEIQEEEGK
jgi:hypothetical protein